VSIEERETGNKEQETARFLRRLTMMHQGGEFGSSIPVAIM
jgi:hypothetical protein